MGGYKLKNKINSEVHMHLLFCRTAFSCSPPSIPSEPINNLELGNGYFHMHCTSCLRQIIPRLEAFEANELYAVLFEKALK